MSGPRSCFVITLTYVAELLAIDAVLDQHGAWLQRRYDEGIFLVSGRLEPRTGGLIIAMNVTRTELETSARRRPVP